jgi:hypothetical protein
MHIPVSKFLILYLFKLLLSQNIHWATTSEHLLRLNYDSYFLWAKFWVKIITTRTATAFQIRNAVVWNRPFLVFCYLCACIVYRLDCPWFLAMIHISFYGYAWLCILRSYFIYFDVQYLNISFLRIFSSLTVDCLNFKKSIVVK